MIRAFLKDVPVPTAGLALGVVALGKLIGTYSPTFEAACAIVALILVALVTAKIALCFEHFRNDISQPVQAAVFGTFFMTFMQLSTYLAGSSLLGAYTLVAAQLLWSLAVAGHFALMAWFTRERIRSFSVKDVFATWFVCYVGIIVGSLTSPAVQMTVVGQGLFWFGFVAYIALLFIVTARYLKEEVPAGAAPTFCIYAAPMSLSLAGYLAVYDQPNVVFVAVLELLAQALLLMVLVKLPKFLRGGFFPSFAAMTFPFVISATALSGCLGALREAGMALPFVLDCVFYAEMLFAGIMTLFVFGCFVKMFVGRAQNLVAELRNEEELEASIAE